MEQWHTVLSNNGFSGINLVLDDLPEPITLVSTIIGLLSNRLSLLSLLSLHGVSAYTWFAREICHCWATVIAKELYEMGIDGVSIPLSDPLLPSGSSVVSH